MAITDPRIGIITRATTGPAGVTTTIATTGAFIAIAVIGDDEWGTNKIKVKQRRFGRALRCKMHNGSSTVSDLTAVSTRLA
jgi:hypothetical protein